MNNGRCQSSTVQPQAEVTINEIPHAATVVHKCQFAVGHEGPKNAEGQIFCVCKCGLTWPRFHSVPTGKAPTGKK